MEPTIVIDTALLRTALTGTSSLIAGVPAGLRTAPTPCPDFAVHNLADHLVGFMRRFEAVLTTGKPGEDSAAYVSPDPAAEYAAAAEGARKGLTMGSPEDMVELTVGPMPRWAVYLVMMLETTVHGWDLAKATGQPVAAGEEQAETALQAAHMVIKPEYRGPGRKFGPRVEIADVAPAIDRLVAFTGRRPGWHPAA
jgi:uncharacterized protein (TIGR03086 family)